MTSLDDFTPEQDDPGMYDESADLINDETVDQLRQTRPWVIFMAVLGFIAAAFMALATVGMLVAGSQFGGGGPGAGAMVVVLLVYAVGAALYFFTSLYLIRYAGHIGTFSSTRHVAHLNAALTAQKSFWRLVGIAAAVYVVIMLVFVMFAMIGSAAMSI